MGIVGICYMWDLNRSPHHFTEGLTVCIFVWLDYQLSGETNFTLLLMFGLPCCLGGHLCSVFIFIIFMYFFLEIVETWERKTKNCLYLCVVCNLCGVSSHFILLPFAL